MGVLKKKLTIEDFIAYSTTKKKIELSNEQIKAVKESAQQIEKIIDKEKPVYGINTGFGALCNKIIDKEYIKQLQKNLIRSHACGIGKPLTKQEIKGTMLLLINSLSKGYSGIRPETLDTLIKMYNKEVLPVIPEKGSLGASGDLIPLAHLALTLIGEGKATYKGRKMKSNHALRKAGIKPIELKAKEGLALINGTHVITAISAFNLYNAQNLSKTADIAGALTLEALKGTSKNFDNRIHKLKPHKGQKATASNLRKLISKSEIIASHKRCEKVQDPYSLRCIPQIHGPVKDEINHIKKIIETEMNSVTDNPLIFETVCLSGGNFHGQYISLAMDNLLTAMSTLAGVSERRIERLLNSDHNGLTAFLTKNTGLNSGLMITQYLAAQLLSINKVLSYPASTTSIPVSANQEDYVSMAMTSTQKTKEALKNIGYVLAIELLCGAQAIEFHNLNPGKGTKKTYQIIREKIKPLEEDRSLCDDIEKMFNLIYKGIIVKEIEQYIGGLK